MLGFLILAFITLPVIELMILLRIGSWLGILPTVLLIIVTGIVGAAIARSQGLQVLNRMRQDLAGGRPPIAAVVDGALILIAGVLLLTPGVVTDAFGLALLLPPVRTLVRRTFSARLRGMVESGRAQFTILHGTPEPPARDHERDGRDVTDL